MGGTTNPRFADRAAAKTVLGASTAPSRADLAPKPWLGPALLLAGYFAALAGLVGVTAALL
jgi:hypothetical protein